MGMCVAKMRNMALKATIMFVAYEYERFCLYQSGWDTSSLLRGFNSVGITKRNPRAIAHNLQIFSASHCTEKAALASQALRIQIRALAKSCKGQHIWNPCLENETPLIAVPIWLWLKNPVSQNGTPVSGNMDQNLRFAPPV